ncbi:MAG: PQQ-dependent sugar dehydrogenase [Spongiibacteraceae bacterium]
MRKKISLLFSISSLLLIVLLATPFLLIKFGPSGAAVTSKLALQGLFGYRGNQAEAAAGLPLQVADGYKIEVYAEGVGRIRMMAVSEHGDVLVSRPREGDILLLARDANGDGKPDAQRVLLSGLHKPHSMVISDDFLYIAESNAVGRVEYNSQRGEVSGHYSRIIKGLGDNGNHWTKTLGRGADGWFYLTSGSSCNVCEEEDEQRATMMRFKPDGSTFEIYARGLRNSVGFDWAPWSGELYATDNGRDLLGDDYPPCELNRVERGGFYGWPYINGSALDPDLGVGRDALLATAVSPAHEFRAHNAPLGMRFLRHQKNPKFAKTALVALHGSWNRSEPDGYRVVALHWQEDGSIVEHAFVSGFLNGVELYGRPVDVVEASDGSIYVSDDYGDRVYRITAAP